MIRLFNVFCKLIFLNKTAEQLFYEAISIIDISSYPCPACAAKNPKWAYFDSYDRNLISFEQGKTIDYTVTVPRYECASCQVTHALVPEIAVPYSSHSIVFILSVLKDRNIHNMAVAAICGKYSISVSTFYRWKKLYEQNKMLWSGILDKARDTTDSGDFLNSHPSPSTSTVLYTYWLHFGISFLQKSLRKELLHFDIRLHPPPAYSPAFHIT